MRHPPTAATLALRLPLPVRPHGGDAQGIAFHPCAGELEHGETGDVGDGGFGIGDVNGMVLRVQQGEFVDFFADLQAQGFARVRVDGEVYQLDEVPKLEKNIKHNIDVVIDRVKVKADIKQRLAESFETALRHGNERALAMEMDSGVRDWG